jgi:DNA-binding transcriptional MerR regulator
LSISNTKISSLKGVEVKGRISDYGTPIEAKRTREAELKKLAEAESRREDGDWDLANPNIDEEGLAANALFGHLVSQNILDEMDDETKELLKSKIEKLKELKSSYNPTEDDSQDYIYDEMSDLEDEIEQLQVKYGDVYYIIPTTYRSYNGIYNFEVVGQRGKEYMVGTYDDMYEAAIEKTEQLLDDVGLDGLKKELWMNNLDKDSIREYIEEFYDNDIRESPESHFRQDDYELTDEQEERKEQLENQISDLKEQLENTQEEDEINDLEQQIDELQDEFDSIEPDDEPTEEMIEEKVSQYVKRAMRDPANWFESMGLEDSIQYYVNMKGVAKDIVDHDGIGTISSYDGSYDDVYITGYDGTKYTRYNFVVVRTN